MTTMIRCDEASLAAARSGAIWGGIWVEIEGRPFPELHWNDLAVAVMVELLGALRGLIRGTGRRVVRFFDGPHWVAFEGSDSEGVSLSTSDGLVVTYRLEDCTEIFHQAEGVARSLVAACAAKGWSDQDDVRRLSMEVASSGG